MKTRLYPVYVATFVIISVICGMVYAVSQSIMRSAANDPQIQIAEDAVVALKTEQTPQFGPDKIDIAQTLSVFFAVYDKDGNPIDSNANLDGQLPKPPKGVFEAAKQTGTNTVTWEPKPNLRFALVAMPIENEAGEFIAVGRSLREVEKRENDLVIYIAVAWVVMIIAAFAALFSLDRKNAPELESNLTLNNAKEDETKQ